MPSDVQNVIPGDFDRDGRLDLLVMSHSNEGWWGGTNTRTSMNVYLGRPDGAFSKRTGARFSSVSLTFCQKKASGPSQIPQAGSPSSSMQMALCGHHSSALLQQRADHSMVSSRRGAIQAQTWSCELCTKGQLIAC